MTKKIDSTIEAWESRELGADENFVEAVEIDESIIDDALELKMISIRLQKSLLEELKMIAELRGLGYQPLIKQILRRFADCEKKQLLREAAAKRVQEMEDEAAAKEFNETKKAS